MPVTLVGVRQPVLGAVRVWWSFPPFFAFIDSHYGPMGGAVKWLNVWGVTAP
jgi:hypothetical protein